MDNLKTDAPFPQANDFEKVYKLINVENQEQLYDNDFLCNYLNISLRQVNYYLAACKFLNIIDEKRNFTYFGNKVRASGIDNKIILISSKIISSDIFSEVFMAKYFNNDLNTREISEIIKFYYGEEMAKVSDRRASTVSSWIKWIENQKNIL